VAAATARRAPRQPAVPDAEFRHALAATAARLGLAFKDADVLVQAVTHVSFAHGKVADNSRLALLGAGARQRERDRQTRYPSVGICTHTTPA
jgi:hypothetical protein